MLKNIFLVTLIVVTLFSAGSCNKDADSGKKYKARFEINGACANYTFSVIEGDIDPSLVEASWTFPGTEKPTKMPSH